MTLNELIEGLQRSQKKFGELEVTASFGPCEWNIVGLYYQAVGPNNMQPASLGGLEQRFTLELKDNFLPSESDE